MGYALPTEEPESSLVKGTVTGVGMNDGAMLVRTPRGIVRAERAAGCLLKPRCGDTVLTSVAFGSVDYVANEEIAYEFVGNGIVMFDPVTKNNVAMGSLTHAAAKKTAKK